MNKEILNILAKKWIIILAAVTVLGVVIYYSIEPANKVYTNIRNESTLKKEIEQKNKDLANIIEDNKRKNEAAKTATVKDFFKIDETESIEEGFSPMLDNIVTYIKQEGLRIKSINNTPNPSDDNLLKNGMGAYSGSKVDFELVGYYPQFDALLSDLENYPYFISVNKFEITPYQYDKRILIANVSVVLYSKR